MQQLQQQLRDNLTSVISLIFHITQQQRNYTVDVKHGWLTATWSSTMAEWTMGWLRGTCGRTSVSDRRTFPVLRSTWRWWVTTYVVNRPLQGQPTRPTHLFEVDKWVATCKRMCATSLGWRHLVNSYGVKAGWFIPLVDKRVGGR